MKKLEEINFKNLFHAVKQKQKKKRHTKEVQWQMYIQYFNNNIRQNWIK